MNTNLFDHINIDKANTYVAQGMGDAEANAAALEAKVREGGVADLQLLGIGNNGHIAFNEAADVLHATAHIEKLTESTIQANSRFFEKKGRRAHHRHHHGHGRQSWPPSAWCSSPPAWPRPTPSGAW